VVTRQIFQDCLPLLSWEHTARTFFRGSSGIGSMCSSPRILGSPVCLPRSFHPVMSTTRQGEMRFAGGRRSNFSVSTGRMPSGEHRMHTTSCMHTLVGLPWNTVHGDRSDALPRGLSTGCTAVHGVSKRRHLPSRLGRTMRLRGLITT